MIQRVERFWVWSDEAIRPDKESWEALLTPTFRHRIRADCPAPIGLPKKSCFDRPRGSYWTGASRSEDSPHAMEYTLRHLSHPVLACVSYVTATHHVHSSATVHLQRLA